MSRPTHHTVLFTALLLAGSVTAAVAQSTTPSTPAPATPPNTAPTATTTPAPAMSTDLGGSLTKSHDAWRSTKLSGASVYNEQGDRIGIIDDMLLGSQGQVSTIVLSVGGFLGIGSKYVEIPFSQLQFVPSKRDANASDANNREFSVVLPGATKDSLTSMTAFSY